MTTSHPSDSTEDVAGHRTQQSPLASQRAKERADNKSGGRFTGLFPLGYKEGFSQWWANIAPATAEQSVLSFIPHLQKPPTQHASDIAGDSSSSSSASLPIGNGHAQAHGVTVNSVDDPYGPRVWNSTLVKLSGKNRGINEFSVQRAGEEIDNDLVMLHGYGAGLGFFYRNYEGLSRAKGWKIWSLDLLGMGRSTRPPFKIAAKDQQGKITEAENWFIDALEEWRIQRKLEKFTLLGHSLGGYLAVAYALKYPGHLKKLILASPVGIPEDPYAVNADMPEPETSTYANEFTQDQEDIVNHSNPNLPASGAFGGNTAHKDNNNFLNARKKAEKEAAQSNGAAKGPNTANTPDAPRRPIAKWITYLWDANISPFSLVRWSGPLGPRLVSGWTSRRFSHLPPDEAQALHDYSYSLFRQRGSGEYALAYILAPGAFARSPLIRRIAGVGNQVIPQKNTEGSDSDSSKASTTPEKENGIPIVLMYGENDWMDIAGGYAAEQKIKDEDKRIKAELGEKSPARNSDAKVVIIKRAGHHVYLDGWEEFNEVMLEEMEDVNRRARRGAC